MGQTLFPSPANLGRRKGFPIKVVRTMRISQPRVLNGFPAPFPHPYSVKMSASKLFLQRENDSIVTPADRADHKEGKSRVAG